MRCNCAPLLAHVNLLIALYAGATLVTAARLKWDPTTYMALREMFRLEYQVSAIVTTVVGAGLLLVTQIAGIALYVSSQETKRTLLYFYVVFMLLLLITEVLFCTWIAIRIKEWLASEQGQYLQSYIALRSFMKPMLEYVGQLFPLKSYIDKLVTEAKKDAMANKYVAGGAGGTLVFLQLLAMLLALIVAHTAPKYLKPTYTKPAAAKPVTTKPVSKKPVSKKLDSKKLVSDKPEYASAEKRRYSRWSLRRRREPAPRQAQAQYERAPPRTRTVFKGGRLVRHMHKAKFACLETKLVVNCR